MHGDEFMVLLIILSFFALLFGIFYIRNKENMALIERGINPRLQQKMLPRPFGSLKYGLLILGCGVGLFIAFMIDLNFNPRGSVSIENAPNQDYPQIYFALIAVGGGLGLVISYLLERKYYDKIKDSNE
jgi:hypothetical protein